MRPLVVTPGDPRGIGPEVAMKALARFDGPVVVVGDLEALRPWTTRPLVPVDRVVALTASFPPRPHLGGEGRGEGASFPPLPRLGGEGRGDGGLVGTGAIAVLDPGDSTEPVEVRSLRIGVEACLAGEGRALVTGPIHKGRLAARGFAHPGHTEFLAELCGVKGVVMAFVGGAVRVALVTVHLPLRSVAEAVTTERVLHTLRRTDEAARGLLGGGRPRIVVCGLNPHAGDGGLLGREDGDEIAPAVVQAQAEGIDARGPISAEAAFRAAVRGEADWVVAMYHDQGLAPLKALEWSRASAGDADRAVNVTLGLPILRVGVDHGTADDIALQGIADEGSFLAALRFADQHA